MPDAIESIYNFQERLVIHIVNELAPGYSFVANNADLLADVTCVALNRLPPRYIRHTVDFAFYLSDQERAESEQTAHEAVKFAFEFVQARIAMRARR
jgi:hypothetical protein